MIWSIFLLSTFASAAVSSASPDSHVQLNDLTLTGTATEAVQDAALLTQLNVLWDDSKVEKDFETACTYKPKAKRLPTLDLRPFKRYARDSPFSSVWLTRKITFHTLDNARTGMRVPGTHAPLSIQWDVTNRLVHKPNSQSETNKDGSASIEGGCSFGTPIDGMTKAQVKGKVLYNMEHPKNFQVQDLYRGQVTQASADLTEWFAWHSLAGKFALRLTYTEEMHYSGSPVSASMQGKERQSTKLYCDLFYKPNTPGAQATRVERTFWSTLVQSVKERGASKMTSLSC